MITKISGPGKSVRRELTVGEVAERSDVAVSALHFYESKGWMVGKNKMKQWRSAVATWAKKKGAEQSTQRKRTQLA